MDADLPRKPGQRRQSFSTRSLMLAVVLAAIGLGLWLARARAERRVDRVSARLSAWVRQFERDIPPLHQTAMGVEGTNSPLGHDVTIRHRLVTPTYRKIWITAEVRSRVFRYGPNRLTFEAMGRSVERPFGELEGDRMPDLRAMFPEAFR